MERKTYQIVKPEYDSDIYTRIKNIAEIEEEFSIQNILTYDPEEGKRVFLFVDIPNSRVFSYNRQSEAEGNETVKAYLFLNHNELLNYLKVKN